MSGLVALGWLDLASHGFAIVLLLMTSDCIPVKIFLITYGYR